MPTLDELDALCTYIDDQQMWQDCIYRPQKVKMIPKAQRPGGVIWIVKDGKPVDFNEVKK